MLYVLRRSVNLFILATLATIGTYMLASLALNPAKRFEGRNPPIPQTSIDAQLDALGTNPKTPVLERTWDWLVGIVTQWSWGQNISGQDAMADMLIRIPTSLKLVLIGAIIGILLGITIGVIGAVRQYKFVDVSTTYAAFILIATPTFVAGVILMILATQFNELIGSQAIRFAGEYTPGRDADFGMWLRDQISHLLLPTIVMTLFAAAGWSRTMRSFMLDVLGSDYIRTARAKGRTRGRALVLHGVRVAIIPMSVSFAYTIPGLIGGSTFLEVLFSWNGVGKYGLDGIVNGDINAIVAVTAYSAVLTLIGSVLSEILYAAFDPRVRK